MTLFATIEAFDVGSYTATLNLDGGYGFAEDVPCSQAIDSALLVAGARVAVGFADPADEADFGNAIVYAVF